MTAFTSLIHKTLHGVLGEATYSHPFRPVSQTALTWALSLLVLFSCVSLFNPTTSWAWGDSSKSNASSRTYEAETKAPQKDSAGWWNPKRYFQSQDNTIADEKGQQDGSLLRPLEPERKAEAKAAEKKAQIVPPPPPLLGEKEGVVLKTTKGDLYIALFPKEAPQTVANFVGLVKQGFYNVPTMKFHRVVPGFVVQTGDPTGSGMGGSGKRIPLEAKNKLTHKFKGVVAMARGPDPNSATSQFYITLAPQTYLDGKYAIFGQVLKGEDVLDRIEKDDMVLGVYMADLSNIKIDESLQTNSSAFHNFINYFAPSK